MKIQYLLLLLSILSVFCEAQNNDEVHQSIEQKENKFYLWTIVVTIVYLVFTFERE